MGRKPTSDNTLRQIDMTEIISEHKFYKRQEWISYIEGA